MSVFFLILILVYKSRFYLTRKDFSFQLKHTYYEFYLCKIYIKITKYFYILLYYYINVYYYFNIKYWY